MKILNIGKFYPIRGGVEKVMWDLTRGISRRGVDCDMLCAILPEDAEKEGLELKNSVAVITFNGHGRCICAAALAKRKATMLSPEMVGYLKRHKDEYDIIHIHHPDPMAALALYVSGFKGKVVLHWHSDIVKQKVFLRFYMPLQKWLVKRADLILGTTPTYVAQSSFLQDVQQKCDYLPIGVEKLRIKEENLLYLQSKFIGKKLIFSLGRLVLYKGFSYLVEAAEYLPDDYVVVIGGAGPLKEALQTQINERGLADKVFLAGYLSDDEVHAYMAAAKVFVLSSVMKNEAFGIVQVEAMSCGTPLVATRIPGSGTAWVNGDGESGLNVEPCDSRALAGAVISIVDGGNYDKFCSGAQKRFDTLFTLEKMVDGVLEKYEKIN